MSHIHTLLGLLTSYAVKHSIADPAPKMSHLNFSLHNPAAVAFFRFIPARLRGDYTMAANRILFGLAMLVVALDSGAGLPPEMARAVLVWLGLSTGLLVFLIALPGHARTRRLCGIAIDVGGNSILMLAGGPYSSFLYVIYQWIIIGNGFRFGGVFTVAATLASLAGFGAVIASVGFWSENLGLSIGLLLGLVVLPAYSFTLMRQLQRARARAESADKAKSLFLASVSHELRTPLNAITGTAELLRATKLDAAQAQMLETINTAADGQLSLIQDIVSYATIQAGGRQVMAARFDLVALIAGVRSILAPQAHKKGVLFTTYITSRTPLDVSGDERHVREVLLNLCSNALKFTAAGSVSLAVDACVDDAGQAAFRFEVMDTGIGIEPAAQARIFDLFSQADEKIANRFGGMGLGLALCRQQVNLMQGAIGVDSLPGRGSTFWVTLPLLPCEGDEELPGIVPEDVRTWINNVPELPDGLPQREVRERFATSVSEHAAPDAWRRAIRIASSWRPVASADFSQQLESEQGIAEAGQLKGRRVLIADDNRINRTILAKMLEQVGMHCILASDGEEALDLLTAGAVDIAILDINMPEMTGLEVAEIYNLAVLGGERIPLLALTADGRDVTAESCRRAGMRRCLVKPIRTAAVIEALVAVMSHQPAGAPALPGPPAPKASVLDASSVETMPAVPEPEAGCLDPGILVGLQALGGPSFVALLIDDFEEDGALLLNDLEEAFTLGDVQRFRSAAHSFASIAGNIGAQTVGRLCLGWQGVGETRFRQEGAVMIFSLREAWRETALALRAVRLDGDPALGSSTAALPGLPRIGMPGPSLSDPSLSDPGLSDPGIANHGTLSLAATTPKH